MVHKDLSSSQQTGKLAARIASRIAAQVPAGTLGVGAGKRLMAHVPTPSARGEPVNVGESSRPAAS